MERILRRPEIRRITGYSDATIYRKMKNATFPKSIPLGSENKGLNGGRGASAMVGWIESEVAQHIEDVINASRQAG